MSSPYTEFRPAFAAGESPYTLALTIDGTGTLTGWAYTVTMSKPGGSPADGTPSAAVTDAANRVVTVTLPGQSAAGLYRFKLVGTDGTSTVLAKYGLVEVTDPAAC